MFLAVLVFVACSMEFSWVFLLEKLICIKPLHNIVSHVIVVELIRLIRIIITAPLNLSQVSAG